MPHGLRAALLVCLCLSVHPAAAVTFGFSGTVGTVIDTEDFLDSSVAPTTVVTGTYEVTPTSGDGVSPFGVGPAQLSFQLGNYLYSASQSSHTIALINDHDANPNPPPVVLDDIWQAAEFAASELTPASNSSGSFAGYFALLQFFDFDATALDGNEDEPFVPGSATAPWEQVRLTLNSVNDSLVYDNRVKVQVDITSWGVQSVPEARTGALLAFGLASLALRARKFRAASRRRAKAMGQRADS